MEATLARDATERREALKDRLTRAEVHQPRTFGQRIADAAAAGIGSWAFIIVQTVLVAAWVFVNILAFRFKWDPYPFILLNLMFSVQAAYTGPILLLASNRHAAKDRAIAERDDDEIGFLCQLQREQMDILAEVGTQQRQHLQMQHEQRDILAMLKTQLGQNQQILEAVRQHASAGESQT